MAAKADLIYMAASTGCPAGAVAAVVGNAFSNSEALALTRDFPSHPLRARIADSQNQKAQLEAQPDNPELPADERWKPGISILVIDERLDGSPGIHRPVRVPG